MNKYFGNIPEGGDFVFTVFKTWKILGLLPKIDVYYITLPAIDTLVAKYF